MTPAPYCVIRSPLPRFLAGVLFFFFLSAIICHSGSVAARVLQFDFRPRCGHFNAGFFARCFPWWFKLIDCLLVHVIAFEEAPFEMCKLVGGAVFRAEGGSVFLISSGAVLFTYTRRFHGENGME